MTPEDLRHRVGARDHLADAAESVGRRFEREAVAALRTGDTLTAEAAVHRGARSVEALAEMLRVYQAELHAQADELQLAQARSEEALGRFAALFTHLPVAALIVDARGEVVDSNAEAQKLFGLGPRAGGRRFLHRLVEAQDYQRTVRPSFHEARAVGAAHCPEVAFAATGGGRFRGELHVAALPGAAGDSGSFACVVVDRSELHDLVQRLQQANHHLAVSEAFLGESARLARLGGWDYDPATRRLQWSVQLRVVLDIGDDFEPDLESMVRFFAPPSRPLIRSAFDGAITAGTDFDLELDLVSAQGRILRVRMLGHAECVAGRCTRLIGMLQDVTPQHRARQAIDDLTQRLNLAREAGGIGVWDVDLAQDHVFVDEETRALLQVDAVAPDTGFGDLFEAAIDPGEKSRLREAVNAAIDGTPLSIEVKLAPGDGRERWMHLAGRAERDADGRPLRLIGCAWDSTSDHVAARLMAAKEAAEAANRAKSAFLSRMSHELRTPLNAILGFAQLMRLQADAGDLTLKPQRVGHIETAARHLLDLINEVLDVSGIESGQMRLDLQPVALAPLVQECLPLMLGAAAAAGVDLQTGAGLTNGTAAAPVARADRLRLKQVLINLLSNAVKYNRPGGSVHIDARVDGTQVRIEVRDTGHGLTPSQIDGLFQPFSRVGAESSRIEGTGMGLYVCRRFIELMGGGIAVDSAPQVGSIFSVTLPAVVESGAAARPTPARADGGPA